MATVRNQHEGVFSRAAVFSRTQGKASLKLAVPRRKARDWGIRLLWRSWHDRIPYDDARDCAALKDHASPLHALIAAA